MALAFKEPTFGCYQTAQQRLQQTSPGTCGLTMHQQQQQQTLSETAAAATAEPLVLQ
jgi:hypothetical protein